ncbi:Na/Pi cotransporter family protein [Clostridium perfringens]|uniref:Na/Pi cotransporter family protein n=1 Tax=Clostridium perfringens TaxID=1502 RepID=UPI000BBB4C54|nr:Na/Pi cotransporter family protein [Clostridium perfringens]
MKDAIFTLIQVAGGLGLFLFGMKLMGEGLENAAGDKLKSILEKVTKNPISAVLVGAFVTMVIQSSSATTVMVVGFVNAGLMNIAQAAGVIMGANIGTTITAQLVAFKLDEIAPLFVIVGVVLLMSAKQKKRKDIADIVLGFGILFMGMGIMSSALKPLADSPMFSELIMAIGENWVLGIFTGLALTAILQSSSATTGILIALASTGSITINIVLPILFGCNIGTCVTALIASIGANKTAHKAAAIHLMFNILGTLIFIPFLKPLGHIVQEMSPGDVQRQIANAHTIFNITATIILVPLSKYMIMIVNKLIKGEDEVELRGPKYLDERLLETPVIAAGQVQKETLRMANKAKENLELSMKAFRENNESLVKKVYDNEKLINILEEEITAYLVKLSKCDLSAKESNLVASTFHIVTDIERIGDHVENIADLTLEKVGRKLKYSEDALNEIDYIYDQTIKALDITIDSYANENIEEAGTIYEIERKIDASQKEFRENHIKRLSQGSCNAYDGAIFMDLLSNFERIGDHATNIAESVMEVY